MSTRFANCFLLLFFSPTLVDVRIMFVSLYTNIYVRCAHAHQHYVHNTLTHTRLSSCHDMIIFYLYYSQTYYSIQIHEHVNIFHVNIK